MDDLKKHSLAVNLSRSFLYQRPELEEAAAGAQVSVATWSEYPAHQHKMVHCTEGMCWACTAVIACTHGHRLATRTAT